MKHPKMQVQADRIEQVIEVFQNAEVFDLALLMEDARFLACQLYPFSREVGEMKRLYNEAHVLRRVKFAELVHQYREGEGLKISEAERKAENHKDYIALYKKEYECDARYEKGKLMLSAMGQVHSRMTQECAELRQEKKSFVSDNFPTTPPYQ